VHTSHAKNSNTSSILQKKDDMFLYFFKSQFQFSIIIFHTFIAVVVEEQAERQAIGCSVFYYAVAAFAVAGAGCFGAGALFFFAIHFYSILIYRLTLLCHSCEGRNLLEKALIY